MRIWWLGFCFMLTSCSVVVTPLKVVGKVTTTTVELAGTAAGAGLEALGGSGDHDEEEED
jgi:hypothetical protein